ncbi:MAG: sugar isomerase domain-containing protein [Candidatus Acidiferrales bacterium]
MPTDDGHLKPGSTAGSAALQFWEAAERAIRELKSTQIEAIVAAARMCADTIAHHGLVFLFGSGHSRMMVDEMTPRQGCFVGFYPLVELAVSNYSAIIGPNGLRAPLYLEKYEGYADEILKGFRFGPDDVFIIISTSGIRPVVVEMALGAKSRSLPVIAIVSRSHCDAAQPAHSSGKKLTDLADVVIDNLSPMGDCAVELNGLDWRTGPLSTVTGSVIINMVRCETARMLVEGGHKPVMLPSHQFVGNETAEDQLEKFYEAYRRSLRHLYK